MTPTSTTRSATIQLDGHAYHVEYEIQGRCSYLPAKLGGPPEHCSPAESDVEVEFVEIAAVFDDESGERVEPTEDTRKRLTVELNKLPLDDYLLEDWLAGGAEEYDYDGDD